MIELAAVFIFATLIIATFIVAVLGTAFGGIILLVADFLCGVMLPIAIVCFIIRWLFIN